MTAANVRWFLIGLACGMALCVLSLHFLTRPSVALNWPVVGGLLAFIVVFTALTIRSRHV